MAAQEQRAALVFLREVRKQLSEVDDALSDVQDDVDRRIERVEAGENPAGVLTGLATSLSDFMTTVQTIGDPDR